MLVLSQYQMDDSDTHTKRKVCKVQEFERYWCQSPTYGTLPFCTLQIESLLCQTCIDLDFFKNFLKKPLFCPIFGCFFEYTFGFFI